ncbi:MAG: condensation domain-containing protein [Catenulispora sp.]
MDTTTYPMTIGQLSVYRDVERMPQERLWEANLQPLVWDIRTECTVADVWQALAALAMRHESLRTNYAIDDSGAPLQFLGAHDTEEILKRVDRGVADVSELSEFVATKYQEPLDIYHGIPWRAWVLTEDGVPKQVLYIVHHMAADGAASLIMQDDFHALLAGRELPPPAGQPITMALDQQGAGAHRLRAAERYWRRTLEAAPRRDADADADDADAVAGTESNTEMLGATLTTGIPLEQLHAGAAALDVSAATVVTAAFYRTLRTVMGRSAVLILAISANRFDSGTAGVVTSLNQWAPILLDFDGTETFAELAVKVHGKSLNGLKNGICDPDAVMRMREEFFEQADPPVDPGFNINAILAPPGFAPAVAQQPAGVEFATPARAFGPGFYLIVRGIQTVDAVVRCNRPDVDRAKLAAIMAELQATLLQAAGLEPLPA